MTLSLEANDPRYVAAPEGCNLLGNRETHSDARSPGAGNAADLWTCRRRSKAERGVSAAKYLRYRGMRQSFIKSTAFFPATDTLK